MLSKEELTRYSRNILLSEVGKKGQEKLQSSVVTVVGAGGLGSPVLFYLASAGVGEIRIIDSDKPDLTNLQRQILYNTESFSNLKAEEAANVLRKLNPHLTIKTYPVRLNASNVREIFEGSHVILEGSDNFETKFLVNDAAYFLNIPLVIAGILRFEGQVIGIKPNVTACYRCVFHGPPPAEAVPNCAEAGVIGSVAGLVGSIQATETIKHLLGIETGVFGKILNVETLGMDFRKIPLKKNPECPLCGNTPTIHEIKDIELVYSC